MRKLLAITLIGLAFGASQNALAEVANMTNSADGASRAAAVSAVREKLNSACKERNGTPVSDSFAIEFEKKSDNSEVPKPYYVDAKMKCDLP